MKYYSTYLFDWDGCLARTLEVWMSAYLELFEQFGISIDARTVAREVFGDWEGPAKQGVSDLESFTKQLKQKVAKGMETVELYDGVTEVLSSLHSQNKHIALVSSSLKTMIQPALERNNIDTYFDLILDAEDVTHHKPDPEVILTAMNHFNSSHKDTVIIGDSSSDLGAAQAAGIDSFLFFPDSHELYYDKEKLVAYKPQRVFDTFLSLIKKE